MKINTEEDIIRVIQSDEWMMHCLRAVRTLQLPDWWICAGFVRSKIWDILHEFEERTPLGDVDVIYFDPEDVEESTEKSLENQLRKLDYTVPWSVKNQARMHLVNNFPTYTSSVEGISKFPETVTALGVTLSTTKDVQLTAPWGVRDVVNMIVMPTPDYTPDKPLHHVYRKRVTSKRWEKHWNKLVIT
ncbi:nucleotidyltransferase family protein [Evansella sp. AB-rgal1]|uniref:nucleotidyltransferase family protein n=1 Tax=Evansella sp. AB-rgal1 TaxID=3242696 RepID=UPI00359EC3CF